MKVLISGGAGFIGSTVASALADAGVEPVVLDNLSTGHVEYVRDRTFYHGDIADGSLVDKIFAEHDIAVVIHAASLVTVWDSVTDPLRHYRENVGKGVDFIGHLLRNGCQRLIFSSSASIYGTTPAVAVDESYPLAPGSPYARSKVMMERLLEDSASAYGLGVLALRYFNPIGADPRARSGAAADATHVLGRLIEAAGSGEPFTVTGDDWPTRDGTGVRDYVHVWDLALAHVEAVRRFDGIFSDRAGAPFLPVNLGSGHGTTVLELVAAFESATGQQVSVRFGPRRDGDLPGGYAAGERACDVLGWRATRPVAEGIRDALHWASVRD